MDYPYVFHRYGQAFQLCFFVEFGLLTENGKESFGGIAIIFGAHRFQFHAVSFLLFSISKIKVTVIWETAGGDREHTLRSFENVRG